MNSILPIILQMRVGGRSFAVKIIERVAEHYDVQGIEFGRIYHWCPESVVIECRCGKRTTLKRADLIDAEPDCECGMDHTAGVREEVIIELLDEDYEAHHHPWRYWHSSRHAGIPF